MNPASQRAICPGCDTAQRLSYEALTDEMTCWHCGLVSTINEVRAHYKELRKHKTVRLGDLFTGAPKKENIDGITIKLPH